MRRKQLHLSCMMYPFELPSKLKLIVFLLTFIAAKAESTSMYSLPKNPINIRNTAVQRSTVDLDPNTNDGDNELIYEEKLLEFLEFYNNNNQAPGKNETTKNLNPGVTAPRNAGLCTDIGRFVDLCNNHHRSTGVRADDLITNEEIADFFEYLCDTIDNPSCRNTDIVYSSLPVSLQLRFLKIVCPRNANGLPDDACLDELYNGGNVFGVEITTQNKALVERNMEIFCEDIYPLSTNYHYGYCDDEPSQKPSAAPSRERPRYPGSPSMAPSATPTFFGQRRFSREFTYMLGFDNITVLQDVVGEENNGIMEAAATAIQRVLLARSPLVVERLQEDVNVHQMTMAQNGVQLMYKDETLCNSNMTQSVYCIAVVSKVRLDSDGDIPKDDVDNAIFAPIRKSMNDEDSFKVLINREAKNKDDVKDVYYMSDGFNPPITSGPGPIGISGAGIAGICVGVTVFILCCICCFIQCRRWNEDEDGKQVFDRDFIEERDFSDDDGELYLDEEHFEDNDMDFISAYQDKMKRDMLSSKQKRTMSDSQLKIYPNTWEKSKTKDAPASQSWTNADLNSVLRSIEKEEKLGNEIDWNEIISRMSNNNNDGLSERDTESVPSSRLSYEGERY